MAQSKILIANTTWWPLAARLAGAFIDAGASVSALVPHGHPVCAVENVWIHKYRAFSPMRSLLKAIRAEKPDLIVAADDRAVLHLQKLYKRLNKNNGADASIRRLIERSLGNPAGYAFSGSRQPFLEMMELCGVRVPAGAALTSEIDLARWFEDGPQPVAIKLERSWGGSGVRIARDHAEALAIYRDMRRPLHLKRVLRAWLVDRDPFVMADCVGRRSPRVSIQAYIEGQSANVMGAAWRGRVVDMVAVKVTAAQAKIGAATIVQPIISEEMRAVADRVASQLGLSGFFGLDFIIDGKTGVPHLIEMNPRATQLGHMSFGSETLAAVLLKALQQRHQQKKSQSFLHDATPIAVFPQALRFTEGMPDRALANLDVPWSRPELMLELLKEPWSKRGLMAKVEGLLRSHPAYGSKIRPEIIVQLQTILSARGAHGVVLWKNGLAFELCNPEILGTQDISHTRHGARL